MSQGLYKEALCLNLIFRAKSSIQWTLNGLGNSSLTLENRNFLAAKIGLEEKHETCEGHFNTVVQS